MDRIKARRKHWPRGSRKHGLVGKGIFSLMFLRILSYHSEMSETSRVSAPLYSLDQVSLTFIFSKDCSRQLGKVCNDIMIKV